MIVIRTDASIAIGTGHVMRCLTLADGLRERGFRSVFICRHLEGHLGAYILQRGYEVYWIESDVPLQAIGEEWERDAENSEKILTQLGVQPDWLVVDHYGIDRRWERKVKPRVGRILVIDDLANREHAADLLLDQNELTDTTTRYRELVPEYCRVLLGPRFLLLRPGFYKARKSYRPRDGKVRRLLVFFGGSDPTCETEKALKALADMGRDDIELHVVIGEANPRREQVRLVCSQLRRATLHVQAENMAELMAQADFSLGAGGGSMWERCYLGLPAAVTVVADNQRDSVNNAARFGAIWNLGWHDQVTSDTYATVFQRALKSSDELKAMSSRGLEITGSSPSRQASPIIEIMLDQKEN